jgi:tetratricopeptide (TPR) repeat protein
VRSRQGLIAALAVGLGTTVFVLAYGGLQLAHLDPIRFARDTSRPISTFGNADILGGYLSVAAATAGGAATLLWSQNRRSWTVVTLLVALGCVALLIATGVRNGVLGIAAGTIAAAAIGYLRPGAARSVLVATGAALLLGTVVVTVSPLGARLSPAYLQDDPAIQERVEIWRAAFAEVETRPILGVGPDNFGAAWYSVRSARSEQLIGPDQVETSTHGWPFYFLTSAGVLGLGAFLGATILAIHFAVRLARRGDPLALAIVPFVAYLGQGVVNVNDVSLEWVPWLALGLLAGATAASVPPVRLPKRARRTTGFVLPDGIGWAFIALVFVAILVVELPRVGANQSELLGQVRLNAGAQADAVAPETDAVRADPRRAEYWSSLGTALAGVNATAAASAFFVAAEHAPWDRLHWMNIAVEQRALGNQPGALLAARRAVAADPNSARAHRLVASVLLEATDYAGAAREGETALALNAAPEMFEEPILAYIRLERWEKALALAQRAVSETNAPHYHLRLAQALTGLGRYADAKAELVIVLAANPKDPEARDLADFLASKT